MPLPQTRFYISLLGVPLAVMAMKHLVASLVPGIVATQELCVDPAQAAKLGIRTVYTGYEGIDQKFLCFIVPFFVQALATPVGVAVSVDLLALFGVVLAFFAMEGSRTRTRFTLLALTPLFGMLSNLIGVSVAVPLVWIPCYEWFASGMPAGKRNVLQENIQPGRAAAILVSTLIFYVGPTVFMFLNLEQSMHENVIAAWQFAPMFVSPVAALLTPVFHWVALSTPQTSGDDKLFKARWRTIQSKSTVETIYLFSMGLGVIVHYGIIVYAAFNGVPLLESFWKLANFSTDPVLSSPENLGTTVCAYFLLGDLVVLSAALAFFSLLEDGVSGVLAYIVATVVLGPAGGLSAYLAWREAGVQNPKLIVEKSE
ncbi:hypothetical protein BGW37DRAFT_489718 [Umbelopsis sp. PMI_123]|nr:hypothetical protein BGW37DRAFT_489718 [Umbelopsis sp. PMI_123]